MKNLGQILFIILLVAAIFVLFYNWTRKQVSSLAKRLFVVEQEIEIELENLRLTNELKAFLDRKIKLIFSGVKILLLHLTGYGLGFANSKRHYFDERNA